MTVSPNLITHVLLDRLQMSDIVLSLWRGRLMMWIWKIITSSLSNLQLYSTPIPSNGKLNPGQTKLHFFLVITKERIKKMQKYQNFVQVKVILPGRNKERRGVGEAIVLISTKNQCLMVRRKALFINDVITWGEEGVGQKLTCVTWWHRGSGYPPKAPNPHFHQSCPFCWASTLTIIICFCSM